jgi:hypothetical protein
MAFLIPDAPHSSRWFTRRECVVIMSRKRHDHYTVDKRQLHWDQVWDTVKDVKTYLYFFLGWVRAVGNGFNQLWILSAECCPVAFSPTCPTARRPTVSTVLALYT